MSPLRKLSAFTLTTILAAGCGGSPGSSSSAGNPGPTGGGSALVTGIALPQEVSAVPPRSVQAADDSASRSFLRLGNALVASSLPAGSDYATAKTVKWVNEQALSRFDILNSIFKAVGQTHYADAENVNAGPYAALVTSVGEGRDSQSKSLETWVVSSKLVKDASGQDVNVVDVWLQDDHGLVPVEVKIYAPPTQNADGSYANYGVWYINADLSPDGSQFFVASAEIAPDGGSIVKVHNTDGPPGSTVETRGILHKSGAAGYGKVAFPDLSKCDSPTCQDLPVLTVSYAYDAHHVKMQLSSNGQQQTIVKDRDSVVDLVERYGLYDADGNDVAKAHHFGFPFNAGGTSFGYYGAWQGRHQLWANGQTVAAGTIVTRADRAPGDAAETYTASKVYEGILTRRTYVDAKLDDIKNVVVGAWDFQSFTLQGDGTAWHRCTMPPPGMMQPPSCDTAPFTDFASLQASPGGGTSVNIDSWSGGGDGQPVRTILAPNATSTGFVIQGTSTPFAPVANAFVNVNVGGPIWIVFDGTGWVKKPVTSIDPNTQQPTFGTGGTAYAIPDGRELYLNNMGVNYVVQCQGGTCKARLEIQAVANPANVASIVPDGTLFTQQSWGQTASTFKLVTEPAAPDFMKLVYVSVGGQDQMAGAKVGDVVTSGQYGLTATIGGATVQFNWEYPNAGNTCPGCGVQQFLLDGQGRLVQLDDPIRLAPIDLVDAGGVHHTYSLQFDGSWVSGLPDLHGDLAQSNGDVTPAIQAKVVAVPSGTVVADANDGTKLYVFKQLQVSEYLATVADPGGLDLTLASHLDLSTVPRWATTGLGSKPDPVPLKYSEGQPVHH